MGRLQPLQQGVERRALRLVEGVEGAVGRLHLLAHPPDDLAALVRRHDVLDAAVGGVRFAAHQCAPLQPVHDPGDVGRVTHQQRGQTAHRHRAVELREHARLGGRQPVPGRGGGEVAPLGGPDRGEQLQQLELGGGLRSGGAHDWSVLKMLDIINCLLDLLKYFRLPSSKYLMTSNICDLKH